MKYKVGDKTLLGEIAVIDEEDTNLPYRVILSRNVAGKWFTESEIDAIIIKPKRNIDHLTELWESGKEDEAASIMADILAADGSTRRVMKHLVKPYAEPSGYPKLTPEELKAVKWLLDGGFEGLERGRLGAVIAVNKNCIRGIMNEMPVCRVLMDSTWLPQESDPINLRELLAAQEG